MVLFIRNTLNVRVRQILLLQGAMADDSLISLARDEELMTVTAAHHFLWLSGLKAI